MLSIKRFSSIYRIIPEDYLNSLRLIKDWEIRIHTINNKKGLFDVPGILWPIPQEKLETFLNPLLNIPITIYYKNKERLNSEYLGCSKNGIWYLLNKDFNILEEINSSLKDFFIKRTLSYKNLAINNNLMKRIEDNKIIIKWLDFYLYLIEKYL